MKYEKNRKIAGMDELKVMRIAKILIIPLIVIILVLVIILADPNKKKAETSAGDAQSLEVVDASIGDESTQEIDNIKNSFDDYGLQQNAVPEVNEVVAKYQRAKCTGDAELMYRVFGKEPDEDMETLRASLAEEASVYESYDHTVCYTTPGCEEDSYLVYIASDLKFAGIDTPAPMLTWAYVYKGTDGNWYMKEPDTLNEQQKALLDEVSASEDVKMLDNDMRTRLAQAVINDYKLAALYQMWSDSDDTGAVAETDANTIHIEDEETVEGETTGESVEEAEIVIGAE